MTNKNIPGLTPSGLGFRVYWVALLVREQMVESKSYGSRDYLRPKGAFSFRVSNVDSSSTAQNHLKTSCCVQSGLNSFKHESF